MPDPATETPPAELPNPCTPDTIILEGWACNSQGDGWVRVLVPASQLAPTSSSFAASAKPGCGGGCAKAEAIKTARERGWGADELVKVLKAL